MTEVEKGLASHSSNRLFYIPDARRTFVSLDAVFDEDFTSPLSTTDLPFTGTIRLRGIKSNYGDNNVVTEHTGEPIGHIQTFDNIGGSPIHDKQITNTRTLQSCKGGRKPTNDTSANKTTAFLANMSKPTDDPLSFPEYLNVAH